MTGTQVDSGMFIDAQKVLRIVDSISSTILLTNNNKIKYKIYYKNRI